MKNIIPTLHGIIDRRILVNFHVQPETVNALLPPHFRPKLANGWAMAGVCLIRLKDIRPYGVPAAFGLSSENAAHRVAVEWVETGAVHEGAFIPRRDTSSEMQAFAGGRIFQGVHHVATFEVNEERDEYKFQMQSQDGAASVELRGRRANRLPATSIFASLDEASDFFARGSVGYSGTNNPDCCDGLELHMSRWEVEPLEVQSVKSSFFDDPRRFPKGTIEFDCALLMRNIEHEWRALPRLERQP